MNLTILNIPRLFNIPYINGNIRKLSCVLSSQYYSIYNTRKLEYVCVNRRWNSNINNKNEISKNLGIKSCTQKNSDELIENENVNPVKAVVPEDDEKKLGLFARFKLMYKQYWYVLIPVHVITSIGWFAGFYYLSKSGVDVAALLQTLHVNETIISKAQDSDMGHIAIAYLFYKIATPMRYALTLGGTTVAINYLCSAGYIKPVPTKTELLKMYEKKKAVMVKKKHELLQEKPPKA